MRFLDFNPMIFTTSESRKARGFLCTIRAEGKLAAVDFRNRRSGLFFYESCHELDQVCSQSIANLLQLH
jgi:hypothetical protein